MSGKAELLEKPSGAAPPPPPITPQPVAQTDQPKDEDDGDIYELNLDNVDDQFLAKPNQAAPPASAKVELSPEHDLGLVSDELTPGTPLLNPPDDDDELAKLPPPVFSNAPGAPRVAIKPGRCPSCGGKTNPNAVICLSCGFNFQEQKKLETQIGAPTNKALAPINPADSEIPPAMLERIRSKESANPYKEGEEEDPRMRDVILPSVLIPVGMIIQALVIFVLSGDLFASLFASTLYFGYIVLLSIPITIGCAFLIAKILGLDFGPLGPAILKLSAISIFPAALGDLLAIGFNAVMDIGGGIAGWMLSLTLVLSLICYFFRMDLGEAWAVVITMGVIKFILGLLFFMIILTALMP